MSIEVSNIDHLGLVAGIIDEIGIEQKINQLLGEELPEKITSGQVVKGMVLNGLGLVSSPLYLFSKFFEGKAIEHLIGKGVKTEYFNDDKLGRVLDELYRRGLNEIFMSKDFPYKVQVKVGLRELKIDLEKKRAGRFILATNVLDKMELT